jgi:hypothetical protein
MAKALCERADYDVLVGISPSNAALVTWNLSHVKSSARRIRYHNVGHWMVRLRHIKNDHSRLAHYLARSFCALLPSLRHRLDTHSGRIDRRCSADAAPGGGAMGFYFFQEISNPTSLLLTTARPLTDAGGTVPLLLNFSTAHWYSDPDHQIISGMLVACNN